jgi:hypothetical protein
VEPLSAAYGRVPSRADFLKQAHRRWHSLSNVILEDARVEHVHGSQGVRPWTEEYTKPMGQDAEPQPERATGGEADIEPGREGIDNKHSTDVTCTSPPRM